jgi:hypothetical protein
MFVPQRQEEYRSIPALDAVRPEITRTATFALG